MNDKIRKAFESSPLCAGAYLAMTNGHYVSATVNGMWRDWQASQSEVDGALTSDGTNAQQVAVFALDEALEPVAYLTVSNFRGHLTNHDVDYFGNLPSGTYPLYTQPTPPPAVDRLRKTVEEFAKCDGWKQVDGECAFEYVQRKCYEQGVTDAQKVAVPMSDAIASMRSEMETEEPLSDVYLDLLERLQSAIVEDIAASFALGNMPVYATGNGNHVAVHPSAQKPGMFQVSRYALDGIIGDSQYLKIIDLVRSEGLASYSRLDDAAAALVIGNSVEAESKFETRKAQAVPKQQPLGWMIEGSSIVAKGDFAELDTKAEAKRIGGTCKAYPIYREPVLVEQEHVATVKRINGITIGYLDVMQPVGTKLYAAPVDIEALTKERDLLLLQIDVQAGSIGAVQDANQRLSKERDALMTARYAYATEFALDEDGEPDVGSIHQNIRALKAAAKLALDALITESRTTESDQIDEAITALKKAGVQ